MLHVRQIKQWCVGDLGTFLLSVIKKRQVGQRAAGAVSKVCKSIGFKKKQDSVSTISPRVKIFFGKPAQKTKPRKIKFYKSWKKIGLPKNQAYFCSGNSPDHNFYFFSMHTGTVKFFNDAKGFGFVIDNDSKEEFFVHASGLVDDIREGDKVTFHVERGRKGMNAVEVKRS